MSTLAERQKAKLEELRKKPAGSAQVRDSIEQASVDSQGDRRKGRPPRNEQVHQRTVSLTDRHLALLEGLAARSGRKPLEAPRFSDVVRVAFNLMCSRQFTDEEVKKAFDEELG